MKKKILIMGAGLAGMSGALTTVENGGEVILISSLPSERAQSVMAEGGINAAMDTKGESDSPAQHAEDTLRSAAGIVSERAVQNLAKKAPEVVAQLAKAGVQFSRDANGNVDLRNFGGQKKKRTAFAKDDSGKQLVTAMIDAVRRWEDTGDITRYAHHKCENILIDDGKCIGCRIRDSYTGGSTEVMADAVIIASGGVHGLLRDTTGSLSNTGEISVELFKQGVLMTNLEMIQYHPTTVSGNGKRMLITEAARGEGGRLFFKDGEKKIYYMEEKYPEYGNLMPRDVTARENWRIIHEKGKQAYLDLTELTTGILENKLSALVNDCKKYIELDPAKEAIPIEPGIHYFMGGIMVSPEHRTNIPKLFAAGECAAQYHGANRLGGNSLLGAIYGGHVAASTAMKEKEESDTSFFEHVKNEGKVIEEHKAVTEGRIRGINDIPGQRDDERRMNEIRDTLQDALGVVRKEETMTTALENIESKEGDEAIFAQSMLMSAIARRESRGGHYREDYPQKDEEFQKASVARYDGEKIKISFVDVSKL